MKNSNLVKDLPVLIFRVMRKEIKGRIDYLSIPFNPETEKIDIIDNVLCHFLLFLEGKRKEEPKRLVLLFGNVWGHIALHIIRYGLIKAGSGTGGVWRKAPKNRNLDLPFFYCLGGGFISKKEGFHYKSKKFGPVKNREALIRVAQVVNIRVTEYSDDEY